MNTGRWKRLIVALALIVAATVGIVVGSRMRGFDPVPATASTQVAAPTAAIGGPFTLVDQLGRTVTDKTLTGKPFAIFFGFTRCPDVCPTTLSRMTKLRRELGADGDRINLVFVSVDPGHDKREDIGGFLSLFDTPIIGLTGTQGQLDRIIEAYRVHVGKEPLPGGDYTIDHTASVFLMGPKGEFVSTIGMRETETSALQKLRQLIDLCAPTASPRGRTT